jgi:uncharacterized protein (DUF1778 family)
MANTDSTRTERIEIRTKPEVKYLIERAAELQHTTVSAYLLNSALEKARTDINEANTFVLSERDRERFFSALQNPPAPNKALRDLFSDSNG